MTSTTGSDGFGPRCERCGAPLAHHAALDLARCRGPDRDDITAALAGITDPAERAYVRFELTRAGRIGEHTVGAYRVCWGGGTQAHEDHRAAWRAVVIALRAEHLAEAVAAARVAVQLVEHTPEPGLTPERVDDQVDGAEAVLRALVALAGDGR